MVLQSQCPTAQGHLKRGQQGVTLRHILIQWVAYVAAHVHWSPTLNMTVGICELAVCNILQGFLRTENIGQSSMVGPSKPFDRQCMAQIGHTNLNLEEITCTAPGREVPTFVSD